MSGKPRRISVWVAGGLVLALIAAGLWWIQSSRAAGTPTIAFIPQTTGAMLWEVENYGATAERLLANRFPDTHVVGRGIGAYGISRVEAFANDAFPDLRAVLSFTAVSTRGIHSVLKARSLQRVVTLVGCEQDSDVIGYLGNGEIAALVAENTHRMGYVAVGLISDSWAGRPIPARSVVPPLLLTKQNLNSPEAAIFATIAMRQGLVSL